ncbi:DUF751 family protein [Leptolyngbya sp. FACHB-36]|uniref:DUF751 family protein n=1 Tax=Leptolyngbya sp. FACHB-36 TaxID=2692808 RepID=UPI0016817BD9|nr:DUF751 family protein [Leptolyngbya sp. FACHB-36]MBD2021525.1 DUF751 family protein [Leptolyngbya sp. FACHB-36]
MQSFWNTISKYPLFLLSVILGVLFNAIRPLAPLLKRPSTAIALIGAVLAGIAFIGLTLRAMLGFSPV